MAQNSNDKKAQHNINSNKNIQEFNKFLTNNADFLQQKYEEHFSSKFKVEQLANNENSNEAIKFIYDVFSFGRYQGDSKMNQTLKKSLKDNLINFVKNSDSKQQLFNNQQSVLMLQFCIQNNDMFAVHYDKKQKIQEKEKFEQEKQIKDQKQDDQKYQEQVKENNDNTLVQKPKKNSSFQEKIRQNQKKLQEALNQMKKPEQKIIKQAKFEQINYSEEKLKKQAQLVFNFYCKQQLNSGGPNATFDKILHQTSSMTLGKFMAFANTTGILIIPRVKNIKNEFQEDKSLDKKTLINEFKKIIKSKKQIQFQDFFQLLKSLQKLDSSIYSKLGMGNDEASTSLIKRLKYLNTPFNMKDFFAREKQSKINQGVFIPKITSHSGKFNDSLHEEMKDRKKRFRYLPMQPYPNSNVQQYLKQSQIKERAISNTKKIGLSKIQQVQKSVMRQSKKIKLQNSKISFNNENLFNEKEIGILQNLIVSDDYDDQFLKQYKIPKKTSILSLKHKVPHYNSLHIHTERQIKDDTQEMKVKNRKGLVVKQIKERVKELQQSQRKGQTSIQKKRIQTKKAGSLTNRI